MGKHSFEAPSNWKGVREVSGSSFEIYEPEDKPATSRRLTLPVMHLKYSVFHTCTMNAYVVRLKALCPANTFAAFLFRHVAPKASASDSWHDAQDTDITAPECLPRPCPRGSLSRSESTTNSDMTGNERRSSRYSREFGHSQSESELSLINFAQVPSPVLPSSVQVNSQRWQREPV